MLPRSTLALLLAVGTVSALDIKGHDAHWSSPDSTQSLAGVDIVASLDTLGERLGAEGDDAVASSSVQVHRPRSRHVHQPRGAASGLHVHRPAKTAGLDVHQSTKTNGRHVHYPSLHGRSTTMGATSGLHGHQPANTSRGRAHLPRGAASGLHVHRPAKTAGLNVHQSTKTNRRHVHYPSLHGRATTMGPSSATSPLQATASSSLSLPSEGADNDVFEDVPVGAQVLTHAGSPVDRQTSEASRQSQPKCLDSQRGIAGHDGIIIMVDLSNVKDIANLERLLSGLKSCSWSQKTPKYILYNDHAKHQSTLKSFMKRFDVTAIDMDKPLGDLHIWSHPQEFSKSTKFNDSYGLGYRMMCEAWGIKMPEVARKLGLKYFMRLDSDSKMTCDADRQQSPFDIMRSKCLKYGYYNLSRDFWYWTQGFREFLIGYAATHQKNFLPGAMESMASINAETDKIVSKRAAGSPDQGKEIWLGRKMFYNNFEILQVDHFLQDSVKDFTAAVAKSHGIYKHRWGDAVIRYYQVALFAKPEDIGCFGSDEFHYSHANNLNKGRNIEGACTKQIV